MKITVIRFIITLAMTISIAITAYAYHNISPYAWCAGNPVLIVDLDGRDILFAKDVSEQFKRDYQLATNLLKEKGVGDFITKLENNHNVILYISESKETTFCGGAMTINWNPSMGILTNENICLSPTTALNHEFDHAIDYVSNPQKHTEATLMPDSEYETIEERRVITISEQRTARALGEIDEGQVTRKDHYATPCTVVGPTSNIQDSAFPIGQELDEIIIVAPKKVK